jgi:DNA-binding Lrp family transcriptional regulator
MKIDAWDKKIISNLKNDSRQSLSALSKKVRLSKENIHYRLKKYEKNKFIEYVPNVNFSKLGYNYLLINIRTDLNSDKIKKFISKIQNNKKVIWIAIDPIYKIKNFNLSYVLLENDFSGIQNKLTYMNTDKSIEAFTIFLLRNIGMGYNDIYYGHQTDFFEKLGAHRFDNETVSEQEKKLVFKLLENSRIPLTELSDSLKLNPKTVKSKINKLIEEDKIKNFTISLRLDQLDGNFVRITYFADKPDVSREIRALALKYLYETCIISPFFTQKRFLYGRIKNQELLLKFIEKLKNSLGVEIIAAAGDIKILKNKFL